MAHCRTYSHGQTGTFGHSAAFGHRLLVVAASSHPIETKPPTQGAEIIQQVCCVRQEHMPGRAVARLTGRRRGAANDACGPVVRSLDGRLSVGKSLFGRENIYAAVGYS